MTRSFTTRFQAAASTLAAILMVGPLLIGSAMFVASSI
jgi:hypothetical protein